MLASGAGESFLPAGAFIADQDIGRAELPGHLEVPSGAKIDSLVILPMVARGRTVGVLSLGLGPSGRTYDSYLMSIISDLVARAAIAMDNALLYKEMREQDRRKDEFLAMLSARAPQSAGADHERRACPQYRRSGQDRVGKGGARASGQAVVSPGRRTSSTCRESRTGRSTSGSNRSTSHEVIAVAVETTRPAIDARGHTLTVRPPADPVRVSGDFAPSRPDTGQFAQQRR